MRPATLFEEILVDEEEHVDYLEGQLHAIGEMGIENYLAQQLHKGERRERLARAVFQKTIQDGVYLRLLEERHAPEVFAAVDQDRAYLREWLPWVDGTTKVDDTASVHQERAAAVRR